MECSLAANQRNCACSYSCERRGKCCSCIVYHKEMGELPGCLFSPKAEKTYDRSIANFIRDQQGKN